MPIKNYVQPQVIYINDSLRLISFRDNYTFALKWYQDLDLVKLVDGPNAVIYTEQKLKNMYEYLNRHGELYFIEVLEKDHFRAIGDVTLSYNNLPIVIADKSYHNKGIGKMVLTALILRAIELNFTTLNINEIYTYNLSSQKLFESVGFIENAITKHGKSYILNLNDYIK